MFKTGEIPFLLTGKPEFRLLVKEPVYLIFKHAYRKLVAAQLDPLESEMRQRQFVTGLCISKEVTQIFSLP